MSLPKRKIGCYTIVLVDNEDEKHALNPAPLRDVITYIAGLNRRHRLIYSAATQKCLILEGIEVKRNTIAMKFASAKSFHRPPLIDRTTADERDNPKTLNEGEAEPTHLVLRFDKEEIFVLLEERKTGMTITQLVAYLAHFALEYARDNDEDRKYNLRYYQVPDIGFLQALNNMKRVKIGYIYTTKQILGSESLKLSNRLEEADDILAIEVKAKRGFSIKNIAIDAFHKLTSVRQRVVKIRVYGSGGDGYPVMLDTDHSRRTTYIQSNIEEDTGLVDTRDIFAKLRQMITEE